ncbi:MAG TPA: sugar porter family MFS transporter [Bacteroidales bacterium]|nr:sugar porter family MFS transporter [Bacteroidales bacterium]
MNNNITYNLRYIWLITFAAALGGFLFGYDFVVIGGAKPFYEPFFNLDSPAMKGWGTSSAIVGCVIGAILCILLSDKLGRKRLLISSGLLFTLSAIGTALAPDFFLFNTFRLIGGVAMGAALNLAPMYIAEIAPPDKRGMMVTINQLMIMIGIVSAQIMNLIISKLDENLIANPTSEMIRDSWSGQIGWRWMFGAEAIPAIVFFILMLIIPESVRWLVKDGQDRKALKILGNIGGEKYAKDEIEDIKLTISKEAVSKVDFRVLLDSKVLKMIGLGVFLAFLQQWSGINVVIYYAADIFQAAGFNLQEMMVQIVAIGGVMLLSVIITIFTVEKMGRKLILLISTFAMAIIYGLIGTGFFTGNTGGSMVVLMLLNVMFYSISLAPLFWVVVSEIYPNRIRGAAMSIAATAHWVANFLLTFSFPVIKEAVGWANNFWLYGIICLIGFIVLYKYLPETKGKSLEQIEREIAD